jgi:hypothetical protein
VATLGDFLGSIPTLEGLSDSSRVLLILHFLKTTGHLDASSNELEAAVHGAKLPPIQKLAGLLKRLSNGSNALLLRSPDGRFALSLHGDREVRVYLSIPPGIESLEKLVGKLAGDAERRFLAEAVDCTRARAHRAAVVMIWLLCIDHLQRYVEKYKLVDFNTALAARTDAKGLQIQDQDDFGGIRDEHTFIEILRSANIVTKDVRKILDEALGFRNTCAHPNTIIVPATKAAAVIEDLVENVILKYPL